MKILKLTTYMIHEAVTRYVGRVSSRYSSLVNSCKLQMLQILDGDGEEDSDEEMYEGERVWIIMTTMVCVEQSRQFSVEGIQSLDIQIQLAEFHG